MTTAAPVSETYKVEWPGDDEPDVFHMWCCNPKVGWCGAAITGATEADSYDDTVDDEDCPLCLLADQTLNRAGCDCDG